MSKTVRTSGKWCFGCDGNAGTAGLLSAVRANFASSSSACSMFRVRRSFTSQRSSGLAKSIGVRGGSPSGTRVGTSRRPLVGTDRQFRGIAEFERSRRVVSRRTPFPARSGNRSNPFGVSTGAATQKRAPSVEKMSGWLREVRDAPPGLLAVGEASRAAGERVLRATTAGEDRSARVRQAGDHNQR